MKHDYQRAAVAAAECPCKDEPHDPGQHDALHPQLFQFPANSNAQGWISSC